MKSLRVCKVTSIVPSDYLKPNSSIEIKLKVYVHSDDDRQKCPVLQWKQNKGVFLCIWQLLQPSFSMFMCLQGVNRVGKDAQVGPDGVRRKDWHNYEAIKRDASRSGRSKHPQRYLFIRYTVQLFIRKIHIYTHNHIPLWVLLLSSRGVNLCLNAVSAVVSATIITNSKFYFLFREISVDTSSVN